MKCQVIFSEFHKNCDVPTYISQPVYCLIPQKCFHVFCKCYTIPAGGEAQCVFFNFFGSDLPKKERSMLHRRFRSSAVYILILNYM